jgi:hypothetical protein
VNTIVVALTTTLAAVTAFYFGSKLSADARRGVQPPLTTGLETGTPPPPQAGLTVTVNVPADGATYTMDEVVNADNSCSPSTGAQIVAFDGPRPERLADRHVDDRIVPLHRHRERLEPADLYDDQHVYGRGARGVDHMSGAEHASATRAAPQRAEPDRAVHRSRAGGGTAAFKLAVHVNEPGDEWEREAERVADPAGVIPNFVHRSVTLR